LGNGVEVAIVWIPSNVGLEGNELALNDAVFYRPLLSVDFQGLARSVLLREWQGKLDAADTDRFAHSILPKVSLRPRFEGQKEDSEPLRNSGPLDMALRKIRDQEASSN
jgi:hypothetical protein